MPRDRGHRLRHAPPISNEHVDYDQNQPGREIREVQRRWSPKIVAQLNGHGSSSLGTEGVPYVFESFELQGILPSLKELGNWKPPANNKTDKRRMELPVENAVVHFP